MLGIPTIQNDYSNNTEIFDPSSVSLDPNMPIDKNRYTLRKIMLTAYKQKGISNKIADQVITRSLDQVLEQILKSQNEEEKSVVRAVGTVIKGNPNL